MKSAVVISILFFLLIFGVIVGAAVGAKEIPMGTVTKTVIGKCFGVFKETSESLNGKVVTNIRLPRVLLSLLAGVALAVSGVAIQGLFRNPLADSQLIGISAGSAFMVAITIILLPAFLGNLTQPFMAFIGAILTLLLITLLSRTNSGISVSVILLCGIAITALTMAFVGYLTFISTENELRDLTFWQLGSTGGANWFNVMLLLLMCIVLVFLLQRMGGALDALSIGEANALLVGVNVGRLKWIVLISVALLVGTTTAFTGAIGFVGLVVPHICRGLIGAGHKNLFISSALMGGLLMVVADTISRTIAAPQELPIGVITAFIGGPFFVWILLKNKRKFNSLA